MTDRRVFHTTVHLADPAGQKPPRSFTFDHSYWSHDGYKADESGVFVPASSKYADQDTVFNDLGRGMLDNVR